MSAGKNQANVRVSFYNARVLQKILISLLAPLRHVALVIRIGAEFQSLAMSLLKLILAAVVLASSFQCLVVPVLTSLSVKGLNMEGMITWSIFWLVF